MLQRYVYKLIDTDVFYVGCTEDIQRRMNEHLTKRRYAGKQLKEHLQFLLANGRIPTMELIETVYLPFSIGDYREDYVHLQHVAEVREEWWISFYRGMGKQLVNGRSACIRHCFCSYCVPRRAYFS